MTPPRSSYGENGSGQSTGVNLLLYDGVDGAPEEGTLMAALGLNHHLSGGVVVVDTHADSWNVASKYRSLAESEPVCLITTDDEQVPASHLFHSVHVASDLTDVGIGMVNAFDALGGENVRVVFESISDLIAETDEKAVFRFLQVITERVRVSGHVGLFAFSPSRHAPSTVATVESLFDGVVTAASIEALDDDRLSALLEEANGDGR